MIKYCISSHVSFQSYTLPILIDSMFSNGISPQDIHIFSGGFDKFRIHVDHQGITHHQLTYNCFDLQALICIAEYNYQISPHWFLLHDTVKLGLQFLDLFKSVDYIGLNAIPLCRSGSMSMGIYSTNYIRANADRLLKFKDKLNGLDIIEMKKEAILSEDMLLKRYYNNGICDQRQVLDGFHTPYGEIGSLRIIEYYKQLDLHKFKANWGGDCPVKVEL